MKQKNKQFTKISSILSAIASGILTDLICEQFSATSFTITFNNNVYHIKSIEDSNLVFKLVAIVLVFFLIWFLIAILLPNFLYAIDRLKTKNKPKYTKHKLLERYTKLKDDALKAFTLSNKCDEPNLYLYELFKCVNELDKLFSAVQPKVIKSVFKKSNSASDIGYNISPYEFKLLINTLEIQIAKLIENVNPQEIQTDYKFIKECITRLKECSKNLK